MSALTWKRGKTTDTYGSGHGATRTVAHTIYTAVMPSGVEATIKSVEGTFFLDIHGVRVDWYMSLKDAKASAQRYADVSLACQQTSHARGVAR